MKALVLYLKCEAEHPRQQIAHRRAALSGRQAIERWHSTSIQSCSSPENRRPPKPLNPLRGLGFWVKGFFRVRVKP